MYITPRVLIQQEFLQLPVYRIFPLPAFIIGPQYALTRYNEAAEKPFTALATLDGNYLDTQNSYIPTIETRYDIPNIPAGGDPDHSYTKVFAEAVEAQYFPLEDIGFPTAGADNVEVITAPSGRPYTNKVRFTGLTLKTAYGHERSELLSNRDTRVGDIVELADEYGQVVRARITDLDPETYLINPALSSVVAPLIDNGVEGVITAASPRVLVDSQGEFHDPSKYIGQYITFELSGLVRRVLAVPNSTTLLLDEAMPTRLFYDTSALNFKGNWVASTAYNEGDIVLWLGLPYRALDAVPDTRTQNPKDESSNNDWELVQLQDLDWQIGGVFNDKDNNKYSEEDFSDLSFTGTEGDDDAVTSVNISESYKGTPDDGILDDEYTIRVTTGGGLRAVRFLITSLNGAFNPKENVALDENNILTVDQEGANYLAINFTGSTNFVLGSSWEFNVTAPYVAVNPTADGFFTGPVDMTYSLKVQRGGPFYDGTNSATCARLLITSSDLDSSSLVLPKQGEYFSVGGYGVTASFAAGTSNNQLIAGDVYYIPVLAAKLGKVNIATLSEDLPELMVTAENITAKLFLSQKSIQIPEVRDMLTEEVNWWQEENYIYISPAITTYDPQLLSGINPVRLPIVSAKLFVEHRDLLQDNINAIDSVRSLADVYKKLGTVHPDNPLAQGVYDAVLNAQNMIVYFLGVGTDDLQGYTEAIKISEKSDKVYSFVPMTFDRTIQDAVVSHVNAFSTKEVGKWRICWLSAQDKKTSYMYDINEETGNPYYATITDDPAVSHIQNKLVTIRGARFIEDGVRPNDTIRLNFRLSPDGKVVYDEHVVDHVRTQTSLTITKAIPAPINTPIKCQVVRHYTKSERAYNISHIAGDYNNRRVRMVFPDTYKYGGITKQGYFAAAGLAGLRSGVVPHQGLTNSEFLGADDLTKVVIDFSEDDLNTLAEQGVWIIQQEVIGSTPYVRHQLTTDERSLNTSEDSITTNVDNISYALKAVLSPYIGRYNINPENLLALRSTIANQLTFFAINTWTARAGNQLVSFEADRDIVRLEQNANYKDRVDVEVLLNVPYPMNYIALTLVVG
jgi:hypothetical protein